jgi:metal-responsive CopG/Arc/MetJ family transcriptional regulator
MVTKVKKSVSLSYSLLDEIASFDKGYNVSEFIENALTYYMGELKRQERGRRDIEIINANAKRLNKEAEENLKFQAML